MLGTDGAEYAIEIDEQSEQGISEQIYTGTPANKVLFDFLTSKGLIKFNV